VSSTITALLKQKYPGSTYLPVGEHGDVPANEELVYRWKHYPAETRAAILNEFLVRKLIHVHCHIYLTGF
jgi:hypothetical protein